MLEYKNYNIESLKNRKCELCKGTLKMIGFQRLNGKDIKLFDWSKRKYHKRCYKKIV
jgi:hypothetical protein